MMAWMMDHQLEGTIRKVSQLNNEFDTQSAPRIGVKFVPPLSNDSMGKLVSLKFTDDPLPLLHHLSLAEIEHASNLGGAGGTSVTKLALQYIYSVQTQWLAVTHQGSGSTAEVKEAAETKYSTLQSIFRQLLRTELDHNSSGHPTLFGQCISTANLSEGQIALLQWAVAIHVHRTTPGEAIITIDQPENHLHPDALIEAITRLVEVNNGGQLWIATHSVPLLAALFNRYEDDISLFCVENGSPKYAGREPERVLLSLMGGEDNIGALRMFIDVPEMLAANRFGAECLLLPGVIETASGADPQVRLAHSAIGESDRRPMKVLDFGAGQGRMLTGLTELLGSTIREKIDYVAWDVLEGPTQHCKLAIELAFGEIGTRWNNDRNTLFEYHESQSFDAAIMCNVLHEIDPTNWLTLFSPNGVLCRAIRPEGKLVIIEDYLMPKGEYAHPFGFTLLDTEALKVLFDSGSEITVHNSEGRYAGRIKAHVIPAKVLKNISAQSRHAALELAAQNAEDQIKNLRANGSGFKAGLAHAFWVQQFANLTIALKNL
ncbi:MAG: hypothetical protein JWP89_2344 [Schlesneria sp.]|nr:hypothetical protein [Schlesneria sp.]